MFVAEWGIQIIGVSQAAQSLELVVLINSIKVAEMQEQNGAKFRRHKMIINTCLAIITGIILIPPIQYIIRATIIYNKDCRQFEALYKDDTFLALDIRFSWFSIALNLVICIGLIVMTCIAIKSLTN